MGIFMFLAIIAIALFIAKKSGKIVRFYVIGIIVIWVYFAYIGAFGGVSDSQIYESWIIFSLFYLIFWLLYNIFKNGTNSSLSENNFTANEFISHTFVDGFKTSLPLNILIVVLILVFGLLIFNGIYRQGDLDKMKDSLISDTLNHHKEFLEDIEKAKGKSDNEAKLYVQSFEPFFQKEKEKFYRYCDGKNLTPYCEVKNNFNEDLSITYHYDNESFKFFNHPPHISLLKRSSELCSKKTIRNDDDTENIYPLYKKGTKYIAIDGYTEGYDGESFNEADCNSPVPKEKWVEVAPYPSTEIISRQFKQIKD